MKRTDERAEDLCVFMDRLWKAFYKKGLDPDDTLDVLTCMIVRLVSKGGLPKESIYDHVDDAWNVFTEKK